VDDFRTVFQKGDQGELQLRRRGKRNVLKRTEAYLGNKDQGASKKKKVKELKLRIHWAEGNPRKIKSLKTDVTSNSQEGADWSK